MSFHTEIIEKCFRIVPKDLEDDEVADEFGMIPYNLWGHQHKIINLIEKSPKRSGHLILKAASVGMSSLALAYGMVEVMSKPNQTMVLITHEEKLSQILLRRAKSFVRTACEASPDFFPNIVRDPKNEIELSNRSLVYIGTAGSDSNPGRGNPFNVLICSECGFYSNAGKLITALLPRAKKAIKIFESTANGSQGWFYHQYKKSATKKTTFIRHFVPWFDHTDYTNDIAGEEPWVLRDKTEEELELQEDFGLTDGKLAWRRDTIMELDDDESKGMSGEEAFKQEYPATWEEAFLRSGSPIFGHRVYQQVAQTICEPILIGDIGA